MSAKDYVAKFRARKFSKKFLLIGGVLLVMAVVYSFISNNQDKKEAELEEAQNRKVTSSEVFSGVNQPTVSQAEVVTKNMTDYINNQKAVNQQLAERIAQLESQNQAYQQAVIEAESNAVTINDKLAQLNTQKAFAESSVKLQAIKTPAQVFEDDINNDTSDDNLSTTAKNVASTALKSADTATDSSSTDKSEPTPKATTYIPSNTFVKGVLISALSANTGGNADTQPTPMLIRITNFAQLPDQFKSNLKSCMVGATGWGDLSTERVKARLTNLSCVLKDGRAIDVPVDGYISGEDAKAGIRGMLVQHSGSLVAKATLAGFVQGIGQIGQAMGQTQTITPLGGVTTTVSPSQALYAGAGAGVSQAGSTLSQYYLSQLQQISPSIEVSAGRHVTVVFSHGLELKLPINNQDSSDSDPLPIHD